MKAKFIFSCVGLYSVLLSCQSKVVPVSSRNIEGISKPGEPYMHGRSPHGAKPSLFVESKNLAIEEIPQQSETGSLFSVNDQRNYLFLTSLPVAVGQALDIKVVPYALDKKKEPEEGKKPDEKADDDAFVKEMLAQLPQLDPGEDGPKLLKSFKVKVDRVLPNGDVYVSLHRSSSNATDSQDVHVKAKIPYSALQSGEELTTQNLSDVLWVDSFDTQLTERSSAGWEDEYSLRLSGFSEAKSLAARQIEDKRKQLQSVKDRMSTQLVSMGKERKKMAEERETLNKAKAEATQKAEELEQVVTQQKSELDDYKEKEKEAEAALAEAEADAAKDGDAKPADSGKAKPAAKSAAKPAAPKAAAAAKPAAKKG